MQAKIIKVYSLIFFFFLAIFFLNRVFFTLYHQTIFLQLTFPEIASAFWFAKLFDFPMAAFFAFLCSLAFLYSSYFKNIFVYVIDLCFLWVLVSHLANFMYFMESGRHLSYEVHDLQTGFTSLLYSSLSSFLNFYLFAFFYGFIGCALIHHVFSFKKTAQIARKTIQITWKKLSLQLFALLIISFIFIRGGISFEHPLSPSEVFAAGSSLKAQIATNPSYNITYHLVQQKKDIERPRFLNLNSKKSHVLRKLYPKTMPPDRSLSKPIKANIIFLLLESWSAQFMKSYGGNYLTTPFFDTLQKKSLYTSLTLAAGRRTPEGLFATACSFQNPLGKGITYSRLLQYKYSCFPEILRQKGWQTEFFQGTNRTTMQMHSLASKLGFSKSFGLAQIPNIRRKQHAYGLRDEDIYDFVLKRLKKAKEPFLFGINTNTTHEKTLEKGQKSFFPKDQQHLDVLYDADQALAEFFKNFEKIDLKLPSIFVLISDHTKFLSSSRLQQYRLPFLIYSPAFKIAKRMDRPMSQRDIAPTLLDLMGLAKGAGMTGKSLLRSDNPPYFAEYYHEGILGWAQDDVLTEIDIVSGKFLHCYHWKKDPSQKKPLPCSNLAKEQSSLGLNFTAYSQNLLFADKVSSFFRTKP